MLRRPSPAWPEVVDAADWLQHPDVSKPLWGEACLAHGARAAIARPWCRPFSGSGLPMPLKGRHTLRSFLPRLT